MVRHLKRMIKVLSVQRPVLTVKSSMPDAWSEGALFLRRNCVQQRYVNNYSNLLGQSFEPVASTRTCVSMITIPTLMIYTFWLTWKMWVYVMTDFRPADIYACGKSMNVAIFSDTINMIIIKHCMNLLLIELYPFILFQWPWLYFKVTAVSNSFNWKVNILICWS